MTNSDLLIRIKENAAMTEKMLAEKLDLIKRDNGYAKFSKLEESMRYSLTAGGKRLRPCLVIEFAKLHGASPEDALDYACSLEMIHTFSLIHDDMPCMDDDELRRGKPTNHIVFGEACALLAGDALLAYAFETLPSKRLSDSSNLSAMKLLALCTGPRGMCGGQQIDLENEGKEISLETLETLHSKKTGALIKCACALGCIAAGINESDEKYKDAVRYAELIGLAFQIADDILDVTGDEKKLGKKCGSDEKECKNTYVTLLGIDNAKKYADDLCKDAQKIISKYRGSEFLCELAEYIVCRDN